MANCYQCGSEVEPGDRFCMNCGAPNPAGQTSLPPTSAEGPGFPPVSAAPPPVIPRSVTTPTWFPPDAAPSSAPQAAPVPAASINIGPPAALPPLVPPQALPDAGTPAPAAADTCPNCSAILPAGARFCGDCGAHIPEAPISGIAQVPAIPPSLSAVPAFAAMPAAQPPILPDPIPPLSGVLTRPPDPAPTPPVLPTFQPPPWALHLGAEPAPFAGAPGSGFGAGGVVSPTPGQPFPLPNFAPAGASPAGTMGRRSHPRSQVITMIVAGVVSVVFGIAGIIAQIVLSK
jgi:hypothetical protein